eukprot:CAMPEP_0117614442 /NCGR_PEP_ID=MMETSP0784-20121206/84041_1 /TAXON_ID=39447 /ORGANISM="" /LENGTH=52 /DNA_ID=CAMNT_0005418177 /DNA_START=97 /DNA_END=251 /DNA_ORIENTATION=+
MMSAMSFFNSACLELRLCTAFETSVSQKPFFVASSVDSFNSRSMRFWMRVFT